MQARRAKRRLVLAALAALAVGACVTPTIPLPPPSVENMSFDLDLTRGEARFSYGPDPVYAGALVYVLNVDRGAGTIVSAGPDGSVAPTPPFPGVAGDRVHITFKNEDDAEGRCVVLRQGMPYACP